MIKKLFLILLLVLGLASPAWAPVSHRSIEDEANYLYMKGAFAGTHQWFDGLIPTALANNVTGITKANPGVVSSTAHGLVVGDLVYFDSLTEMTELNSKTVTVSVLDSANTFSINNTSGYSAAETTGGACGHSVVSLEDFASTGNKLIVYDGAGAEYAEGYIGGPGTGEAKGTNLFDVDGGAGSSGDKGAFGTDLFLAEAINVQNNRDFSAGNIGQWVIYDDSTDSTVTYDTTDLDGADDKQGLIDVEEATDPCTYAYASLPSTSITGLTANILHVITADVHVPAGNTLKDAHFAVRDMTGAIIVDGSTTVGDDAYETITGYIYLAADIVGNIDVGFSGNPADEDKMYFDDISIKPIDISWAPYGTNTMEIDSGALLITYVDHGSGAVLYLRDTADFTADLELLKLYKATFDAKVGAGDNVLVRVYGGTSNPSVTITGTTFASFEIYFTAESAAASSIRASSMGTGEEIWLDNLKVYEVTEPNASAVHIYQEHGLITEGWADIDAGIDYNAGTSWDFDVYPYRSKDGSRLGMGLGGGFCPYWEN